MRDPDKYTWADGFRDAGFSPPRRAGWIALGIIIALLSLWLWAVVP